MKEFSIAEGGRVKMAAGNVDVYYEAAEAMLELKDNAELTVHQNFINLRNNPTSELKAAFFPSTGSELKQRLRGAGLYRFLRMDQGPGGNFTAFESNCDSEIIQKEYHVKDPIPYALIEESVRENIKEIPELGALALSITTEYANNNLGLVYSLLNEFKAKSEIHNVELPKSDVGSRSGFFLINPVETNGAVLTADCDDAVEKALFNVQSYAIVARKQIKSGVPYSKAIEFALVNPEVVNNLPEDLLYFQPDCFVDKNNKVNVEKINFPDVGLFLSELKDYNNKPLIQVKDMVDKIKIKVQETIEKQINSAHITIVVKDEAIKNSTDTLELLEIKSLNKILKNLGYIVDVIGISDYEQLTKDTSVIILNPDISSESYGSFTEKVIKEDIPTFPDPLLKTFEEKATTLESIQVTGKYLEKLLDLVQPKKIDKHNAAKIHQELFRILDLGKIPNDVDIIYAHLPNLKTPIPLFRYSLHSFSQIYNSVIKSKQLGHDTSYIYFQPIPFKRESAVFKDNSGKRLAAFRPMYIKDRS